MHVTSTFEPVSNLSAADISALAVRSMTQGMDADLQHDKQHKRHLHCMLRRHLILRPVPKLSAGDFNDLLLSKHEQPSKQACIAEDQWQANPYLHRSTHWLIARSL
jgi:hypothetical protein